MFDPSCFHVVQGPSLLGAGELLALAIMAQWNYTVNSGICGGGGSVIDDALLRDMLDGISEGVYFVDLDKRISYWNNGAERISGYKAGDILGKRCCDNILRHIDEAGTEVCLAGCPLAATIASGKVAEGNYHLHHREGYRVPVAVKALPYRDESGNLLGSIEIFTDRSERITILAEMEELKKENFTDALTGLANRRFLDVRMEGLLDRLETKGIPFGFLLADIDHFKKVNDTWGHGVGDRVLRMVAWTMANAIRRGDTAVRWGGEEFVILAPGASPPVLAAVAERVRAFVEKSWISLEDGQKLEVTLSIGGAMACKGDDLESISARADKRMYRCKEGGRNKSMVGD